MRHADRYIGEIEPGRLSWSRLTDRSASITPEPSPSTWFRHDADRSIGQIEPISGSGPIERPNRESVGEGEGLQEAIPERAGHPDQVAAAVMHRGELVPEGAAAFELANFGRFPTQA